MAAGAWLLGTLTVHELPALPSAAACVPALLTALLALRYRAARPLLWFLAAAVWTAWCAGVRLEQRLPSAARGGDFELSGFVASFPTTAPGQTTFAFAVAEPRPAGVPPRVRLTWYDPPATLTAGAALTLTARLRPPRGARNPGGFDYEQWLLVNGYGATGYVRSSAPAAPRAELAARWLGFRAALAERLAAAAPDADAAALLVALALGERNRFSEQHWTDFRRTGTSHLVAVSGMHVALLGLLVFAVLRFLWLRLPAPLGSCDLEVAAGASVLTTAYYAALTGFAVPAQRSLVMLAVALAVLVSRRRVTAPQALAATLLIVLAWDPFAPLTASFWLSFTAVGLLLALGAPRRVLPGQSRLQRGCRGVRAFVALQWSIGLALLPLTAWYFGEISVVGPLVNLLAIPWFNLVLVPLTLLATLAVSFAAFGADGALLVAGIGQLASATVGSLHAAAEWPGAALAVPLPPVPTLVLAACGVAFAVAAPPLPGRRLAWLAAVPMFAPAVELPPQGAARAVVLDVGHGLAVLVETRTHRLLFDAGPAFRSGFDSGADIVLPALAANGRRGLDLLIVSHADNDHAGGAAAVAAAFPGVVVLAGPDVTAPRGRTCERGEEWQWDGVRFRILHPGREFAVRGNDSSCVLEVAAGGATLLIAADVERRGEAALLTQSVAADVVVVPHHGSATSSSAAFVAAVGAKHAVVSAGFANRWGFPRAEVRERWLQSGAAVIVTGDVGAVDIALGRNGVRVTAERDGRHRYWQARAAEAP